MAVAMKDLEIRGAGNVLGGEQSGHVEGVGFDLYVRLVGEAVADMRDGAGGSPEEPVEVKVELPVDAHLPQEWIPSERVRLESYQRLADARDEAGLAAVRAELVDRFGSLPDVVERLLRVAELRVVARRAGLAEIVGQGRSVRFSPVELPESRMLRLTRLYPGTVVKPAVRSILVPAPSTARIGGTALRDDAVLDWAENLVRSALLDEPQKGPSS
jgi:transcription-repair coupling factor (superfamily II helicase)